MHQLAHTSSPLFTVFLFVCFFSPLQPFKAKSHRLPHWFRVITLVTTGQQSGKGLGLMRPVIRAQQKPASLYSARLMGSCSSGSPWDFITQKQIDEPGRAEYFFWNGPVGGGWHRQLGYSAVACLKWHVSMQWGDLVRGVAQQRIWHIFPFSGK